MIVPCESCHSKFVLDSSLVKPTGTRVRCSKCLGVFNVFPPPVDNRRKTPRVKTQNLISYFTYNEIGKLISHGLGIALDISKGGILLETPYPMESGLLVLNAFGLGEADIEDVAMPPGAAADALAADELDAFFLIAGTPAEAVLQLAGTKAISLLPISGEPAETLAERYPYFSPDFIPSGTYPNVGGVETLSVGAQWLVSADVDEQQVYELTRALGVIGRVAPESENQESEDAN